MKQIIVILFILVSLNVFTQEKPTTDQIVNYQNTLITKNLDLSEEQQKTVSKINVKYAEKQKEIMEKEGSMFSKIGDIKKLKKDKTKELQNVLNKEQFKIYEDKIAPQIKNYMRKHLK